MANYSGTNMRTFIRRSMRHSGFTLIDLLVAVLIISLLASYVIANFRGTAGPDITIASQYIVSDIRQAQASGLAGKLTAICYQDFLNNVPVGICHPACSGADGCHDNYPIGGYGITFYPCGSVATCRYSTFADSNGDGIQSTSEEIATLPGVAMVGETYIDKVYQTAAAEPPPPWTGSWQEIAVSYSGVVIFNQDAISLTIWNGATKVSSPTYIGLDLYNQKKNKHAFIYISQKTGLIASGSL